MSGSLPFENRAFLSRRRPAARALLAAAACAAVLACEALASAALEEAGPAGDGEPAALRFTEVSAQAGLAFEHSLPDIQPFVEPLMMHSGLAAGDLDGDGDSDLIALRGPQQGTALFRNRGDGTFEEISEGSGLELIGLWPMGVALADIDGDRDLDVFFGGVLNDEPRLFRNLGGFLFEDVTATSGFFSSEDTFSAAFADVDGDQDLDVFTTHWAGNVDPLRPTNHLWLGAGDGTFRPVDESAGISSLFQPTDWSFTPNWADLDRDGDPDLLLATDFGGSAVLLNRGDGAFDVVTDEVISDENGMGASVGDFDGDGHWDWFVSSIWDPDGVPEGNWGITGNRLYRGLGDGRFEDITERSGVRRGFWGWGSCAADFDLDRDLDLYHVNGFPPLIASEFFEDPARLFLNDGAGVFTERSEQAGVDDPGQGRAVVCFDYDLDGDVDILVGNNRGSSRLFRNDLLSVGAPPVDSAHWLAFDLRQPGGNGYAVGAEVRVQVGGQEQLRQVQAGNNFLSQNPLEVHFGLGDAPAADRVEVRWPDGGIAVLENVAANRTVVLSRGAPAVEIPIVSPGGLVVLAALLAGLALSRLRSAA